jgi:hypothetical protein
MKSNQLLRIVAGAMLCLGQVTAYSQNQIYQYSGPINGYTEMDLAPIEGGVGGTATTFGTLNETLTFNPVAQTLDEAGTVTVSPTSGSFQMYTSFIAGSTLVGSATLTVGDGSGTFSFDTGPITAFGSGGGGYGFNGTIQIPINGSGIYNGNAFSDSWFLDQPVQTFITPGPTSAAISENGNGGSDFGEGAFPAGLAPYTLDNTSSSHWELDNVTISAVPEASTTQLLLIAGGALLILRFVGAKL